MIQNIKAIDVHTHLNHGSAFDSSPNSCVYDATYDYLEKTCRAANIEKMFCSTFASVLTSEVVEEENEYLCSLCDKTDGLYQWVVIDPRNDNTFSQADRMLDGKKCVGIKLHPPMHGYSLKQHYDKVFSFAAKRKSIVLIHPEEGVEYLLPMADKYPDVTVIAAHMGYETYAEIIEMSKNNNVYVDTSGIASSQNKIIEYAVERVGSERILFGTDTYAAGFQRGRIEYALISQEDKENILRNNALRLFEKFIG